MAVPDKGVPSKTPTVLFVAPIGFSACAALHSIVEILQGMPPLSTRKVKVSPSVICPAPGRPGNNHKRNVA